MGAERGGYVSVVGHRTVGRVSEVCVPGGDTETEALEKGAELAGTAGYGRRYIAVQTLQLPDPPRTTAKWCVVIERKQP